MVILVLELKAVALSQVGAALMKVDELTIDAIYPITGERVAARGETILTLNSVKLIVGDRVVAVISKFGECDFHVPIITNRDRLYNGKL
jgi:hypothetical protein